MDNAVQVSDAFTVARFEPGRRAFAEIAEKGFRSVVSLQTRGEDQKVGPDEERALAEGAGLAFYQQDVTGGAMADAEVDRFREAVAALPKPVLLHCASGARSGALTIMHVAAEEGLTGDETLRKAEALGFRCEPPELERFVRSYVDRHGG